jgi:hypothetical protein
VAIQVVTGQRVETRRVTALNGLAAQLTKVIKIRDLQSQLKGAEEEVVALRQRCEEYERMLEEALELRNPAASGTEAAVAASSSVGSGHAEEEGAL